MFCYEYGYLLLDGDEVLLVKREESWCADMQISDVQVILSEPEFVELAEFFELRFY
jgi:hypothetical protein